VELAAAEWSDTLSRGGDNYNLYIADEKILLPPFELTKQQQLDFPVLIFWLDALLRDF
jgi:hypothetical protein